ncbi:menaquinone-dependent protoporphyrinogen IX dehydrogenase [Flavobacterium sp. Arc3]|uniref:menaquinone-dependent protoporphyrinogen IX dehydrogenase n=1 Tax=Flavobacterium sp. Arc3 TaxID=3046686 RepID=UPI00352CFFBA
MKLLIIYGTTEGQTRKIARFMQEVLQENGHQVIIADASDEPPTPTDFDAVLIGGSIHMHKYQSPMAHYITSHVTDLNKMPTAFFSVSLAVASDMEEEHEEVQKITDKFLTKKGWKPMVTTQIAGALKYTQYDYFKRLIMKFISKKEGRTTDTSQDFEYTDWNAVKKFIDQFADKVAKMREVR